MSFDPYSELFANAAHIDDAAATGAVGDETAPEEEPVEFVNEHRLTFVVSAYRNSATSDSTAVHSPLFGLLGPISPLPYHYSDAVALASRENKPALKGFLAVLSRRATSLLYRAWRKSRLTYERHPGASSENQQKFTAMLTGLTGAQGMPERMAWLDVSSSRPQHAPDLFVREARNSSGLIQYLSRLFSMPFEVEEFVGAWESLPQAALPSLGSAGTRPSLGLNTVLGARIWQVQSNFRLLIVKPDKQQYAALKPGSESLRRIQLAVRMYCTAELAFRIRILISGSQMAAGTLGGQAAPAILGWNSFSGNPDPGRLYTINVCKDYNEVRMRL
ncbi:MAG: type VI secretion system baseplate subunit TssG [Pseudomonadota bacterium]